MHSTQLKPVSGCRQSGSNVTTRAFERSRFSADAIACPKQATSGVRDWETWSRCGGRSRVGGPNNCQPSRQSGRSIGRTSRKLVRVWPRCKSEDHDLAPIPPNPEFNLCAEARCGGLLRLQVDQTSLQRRDHSLGAVAHIQPRQNRTYMTLDGGIGDSQ